MVKRLLPHATSAKGQALWTLSDPKLVRLPIVSKIKATAFGDSARLEFFWLVFDMARFFQADAFPLLTVVRLLLRHLFQISEFPLSRGAFFPATKGMGHASETAIR